MKRGLLQAGCSVLLVSSLIACGGGETKVAARRMADALHVVLSTDRGVYTKLVVNRLVGEEKVIHASERWLEEKALPLPAQMFRLGAEEARKKSQDFSYKLLSKWPINKANTPRTEVEKKGLEYVEAESGKKAFYNEEERGGTKYFTAVYADVGVAQACIGCHNNHKQSPKRDFALNDVMGGVVLTIPIE
ncbi:MAG: DUF3365 domain-containing protein [Myxococcota bacterium]